jgi:NADH-quinone oxidoreductase subunit K
MANKAASKLGPYTRVDRAPTAMPAFTLPTLSPLLAAIGALPAVGLNHYLAVAGLLFALGFFGVLLRRNTLVIFMSLELMLNASTLAALAFSRFNGSVDGTVFVFFIITVAAAEVAVGLAIIVALFRKRHTVQVEELGTLKN